MDQTWFEMAEVRRRSLAFAVWIPLRCAYRVEEIGNFGHLGYQSEFYGVGTLAVPLTQKAAAEKLGWTDIGIMHSHSGFVQDGRYIAADIYDNCGVSGVHLVLEQRGNRLDPQEWHLHQDLVTTLGLKREGDSWVLAAEGYVEIARLSRKEGESPRLLEIRASHLRDYLNARSMALYATSYRERLAVVDDVSGIKWPSNPYCLKEGMDRWEGRVTAISAGGIEYGATTRVFHVARTDVDPEEDVPSFEFPRDENVESRSWEIEHTGERLFRVEGELWRNEWIEPALRSSIVRGERDESTVAFIVDASGKQETPATLVHGSRWLWFRPDVVQSLVHRRGGMLKWYTRDTGEIEGAPGYGVTFGVNSLGLVNVYAKDIALLPEWLQRIWAGHNIGPDGKVSEELLASQMRAAPAKTSAPEPFLASGLDMLNEIGAERLGIKLVRDHDSRTDLLSRTHRFRATDQTGLYALAKDVARLTADSFDRDAIQTLVNPPAGEKWGSLKSLENLIATRIPAGEAASTMAPLFGVYDLRHADAHLPSKTANEAVRRIGIDVAKPMVVQGFQLLHACVCSLAGIIRTLS